MSYVRKFSYIELYKKRNMKLHPIIQESRLPQETKEIIQEMLDDDFNGDWNLLLEDMKKHAVEEEEYELAGEIYDYLKKYK